MDSQVTTPTSTSLEDVFIFEDFFDRQFISDLFLACQSLPAGDPFIDNHGVFKKQLVSEQTFLSDDDLKQELFSKTLNLVQSVFPQNTYLIEAIYSKLHLPWDIHNDYVKSDREMVHQPFYNILIPLHDVDSRTIIFNQVADRKDFYLYKEKNQPVDNPISEEYWNQYLDYCWPEDRQYLTLQKEMPAQRAGQLIGFRRNIFHASDNFHTRNAGPKHLLQMLLDTDDQ